MKFIIDGTEFSSDDLGDITQRDMLAMPKQAGMGVQTWGRTIAEFDRLALADDGETVIVLSKSEAKERPDDIDPDLLFDSERHLRAFFIMVWLTRRTSGQPSLTFDDSASRPWRDLQFIRETVADDEGDGEDEPDPQSPSASAPDADASETTTSTAR